MRIYIIGPVSGHDDLNYPAFDAARIRLANADFDVIVPHDFIPPETTWQKAMKRSLEMLTKADGIACLPGWRESNGACLELYNAQKLGMPAMAVEEWLDPQAVRRNIALAKDSKFCPRCKRVIPLLMFDRSASSSDGRQSYCRDCMRKYKKNLTEKTDSEGITL